MMIALHTKRRRGNNDGDPTNTTDQNRCEVTAAAAAAV
jgi:hypothetical protein